jgi:hypothetical protein
MTGVVLARDLPTHAGVGLRRACVAPHIAQKSRHSAIKRRTTRHKGYA